MFVLNAFHIILPRFIHGHHIFGMMVFNFEQRSKLAVNRGLFSHFVGDLDLHFFFLQISDKVNLPVIRFSNEHPVTSSFQFEHHDILQYA